MDSKKFVLRETVTLAIGEAICTAIMVGFFALLNKFDLSVLLGGLVGWAVTVGNFFFLAITASLASERAMNQDVEGGKKMVKASQTYRFLGVGAILVLCAASKLFNVLALVLPLLFQRPVLLIAEFFRKKEV